MKLITSVLLVFLSFSSIAQSASKYMRKISTEAEALRKATWDYTQSAIKNKGANKVENERTVLLYKLQQSRAKMSALEAFNGSTYYRDSVVKFLALYESIIANEFLKIIEYENKLEQSYMYLGKLVFAKEDAHNKLNAASENLDLVEKKFADENKIRLVTLTTKTGEKLKKLNRATHYYNSVFTVFFEPYCEEAQFLAASDTDNQEEMILRTSNLAASSKECLARANVKLDFEGDLTVLTDCVNLLLFYQEEGRVEFQKIIDFQKYKAEFQETKTILEAKPKEAREKGEVANFNKLVAEYNQKLSEYNQNVEKLNSKRNLLITNWNTNSLKFFERYAN